MGTLLLGAVTDGGPEPDNSGLVLLLLGLNNSVVDTLEVTIKID